MSASSRSRKPASSVDERPNRSRLVEAAAKLELKRAEAAERAVPNDHEPLFPPLSAVGSLDRRMELLKECFASADRIHRATIDRTVQDCVRIARFLWAHRRTLRRYVSEETAQHLLKRGMIQEEFLRVTFLRSHHCSKTASLYFRATRGFFQVDLPLKAIPFEVTKAGGYQALADANVRFPRKQADPPNEDHRDDGLADEKTPIPGENREPAPESTVLPPLATEEARQHGGRQRGAQPPQTELICTFEGKGSDFLALPLPCLVSVQMFVEIGSDGRRTARISSAVRAN